MEMASVVTWVMSAATGNTITFVTPLIAVALGWFFLDQHPTGGMLVGAPLVVRAMGAAWMIDRKQEPQLKGVSSVGRWVITYCGIRTSS